MKIRIFLLAALLAASPGRAQVPQQLNYQGRVAVQGVNFNGTGQFKFALVDGGVNYNQTATASASSDGNSVTSLVILYFGSGYTSAPAVTISAPNAGANAGGVQATATAFISPTGNISHIDLTNAGSGYTGIPTVTIAPPPANIVTTTYWSNDGTGTAGAEPTAAVALPVTGGLYSVALGDTALAHMTAVPASVFTDVTPLPPFAGYIPGPRDVRLRVWFDDGTHGFQQLSPDQRLNSAPFAYLAGNVPDGAITSAKIQNGAVALAQLADGTVSNAKLAAGAAAANLGASGQSGVASGGIVLSAATNPALEAAGYVRFGISQLNGGWQQGADGPGGRQRFAAVWSGSEMIVWGGYNGVAVNTAVVNTGGRYNPLTRTWNPVTTSGAPSGREDPAAVWSGSEMIVWGGDGGDYLNSFANGGRYNPITNSWTLIAANLPNTPSARTLARGVWTTGTAVPQMIVWGGVSATGAFLSDGGRYNPATNSWVAIPGSLLNTPTGRSDHTVVWTGSEMIVWGGSNLSGSLSNGARYNPTAHAWTPLPAVSLGGRFAHTAVWTGTEMIVWGGLDANFNLKQDGARYNPATNTWTILAATNLPGRWEHTAVWTGSQMLIWGGQNSADLNDGAAYNPGNNTWDAIIGLDAPSVRARHAAIWTGTEMLIFGGVDSTTPYPNDTRSYLPTKTMILYQKP